MQRLPDPDQHEIRLGGVAIPPGQRLQMDLPVARLPTATWLSLPIEVVVGRLPGPRVWLSAAIHGDELNGVEIIRRVLEKLDPDALTGAVIAARFFACATPGGACGLLTCAPRFRPRILPVVESATP